MIILRPRCAQPPDHRLLRPPLLLGLHGRASWLGLLAGILELILGFWAHGEDRQRRRGDERAAPNPRTALPAPPEGGLGARSSP
jgi:hypothetical protein